MYILYFRSLLKLEKVGLVDKESLIGFILSNEHRNGVFSNHKGQKPNPQITSYAIFMLKELSSISSIDTAKVKKWLNSFMKEDGGFGGSLDKNSTTTFTYYIIRSLYLLEEMCDLNKEKLVKFVLKYMDPKGGFTKKLGDSLDPLLTKRMVFLLDEISRLPHLKR